MKYRLDTLVRTFSKWFPDFEKEAGLFSVGDWGTYPDFVYKVFFEERPYVKETFDEMVERMGGGMEGWATAVEWLHKASGCEIEKSKFIIYRTNRSVPFQNK